MTFEEVLRPVTVDEFVSSYLNRSYLRVTGGTGRFAQVVPWALLNRTLANVSPARLKVVRDGKSIDAAEYLMAPSHVTGSQYVCASALEQRLRRGDTLTMNAVHDLFPEVDTLLRSVHAALGVRCNANVYLAFKHVKGFELHWDDHDTLILQVHGRKLWHVYEPTRPFPIAYDRPQDMERPTQEPVWHGMLESGDVLYMPRGWWHVAQPIDGPSLHVTFGFTHPTGLDLLNWLTEELKEVAIARTPLPVRASSTAEREAHVAALTHEITSRLDGESIASFLRWREAACASPRVPALPDAIDDTVPLESTTPLVLVKRQRLYFMRVSEQQFAFSSGKRLWRCDADLVSPLERLSDQHGHSLAELSATLTPDARSRLATLLNVMLEFGLIATSRPLIASV